MSTEPTGWVLGFDTSTSRSVVVLGRMDRGSGIPVLVAAHEEEDGTSQASARLVARIQDMTEGAGLQISEIAVVAVGRGPGTFTGSRVAVATAKGLALALGCPVAPVSTLAALAAMETRSCTVLALLDARRGEVHGAVYDRSPAGEGSRRLQALTEERCAPLSVLLEDLQALKRPDPPVLIGPGALPYLEQIPMKLRDRVHAVPGPDPAGFWSAACAAISTRSQVDPGDLEVVYLRASYAELGINQPRRPVGRSPHV
jgi:tRNA threonylcarbamoyl adenosine modification protein YeaZ